MRRFLFPQNYKKKVALTLGTMVLGIFLWAMVPQENRGLETQALEEYSEFEVCPCIEGAPCWPVCEIDNK